MERWKKGGERMIQKKTYQQNVQGFLHIVYLNHHRTEVNSINHFAWVWAWLEMNLKPVIQGFPFWKKKCWFILEWHWIVCLTLKRPMCALWRSEHRHKSSNDLEYLSCDLLWMTASFIHHWTRLISWHFWLKHNTDSGRRVSEPSVSSSGSYHCN